MKIFLTYGLDLSEISEFKITSNQLKLYLFIHYIEYFIYLIFFKINSPNFSYPSEV